MSDWTNATNEELLDEVKQSIVEARDCHSFSEAFKRIGAKRMKHTDFAEAQRAGYEAAWPSMVEAYRANYLFGHQGLDFLSFLMVSKTEVEQDQHTWSNVRAAAEAVGKTADHTYMDMAAFAASRILPTYEARRCYLDAQGNGVRSNLTKEGRAMFEKRRDDYQAATLKHGWKQPFTS